jgi:hypothetical protein
MVKSRTSRRAGHAAHQREKRITYRVLVRKPEWMRPLGRPSLRWDVNIEIDFKERGLDVVDWIHLSQDTEQWRAFVNMIMDVWVP